MKELKPNSYKAKEEQSRQDSEKVEKKIEPIVSGRVRMKKKGLFQKAVDLMMPEDVTDLKSHMLEEVLIPCAKDTIRDLVDLILFGERRGGRPNSKGGTKVSYRDYYDRPNNRRDYNQVRARSSFELAELIFDTRGEALEVLQALDDAIARYGTVTVADYYEFSGVQSAYTDNKYGWKNIQHADTVSVRGGGFTIRMPRPLPLE